jgi:hypothetical protein
MPRDRYERRRGCVDISAKGIALCLRVIDGGMWLILSPFLEDRVGPLSASPFVYSSSEGVRRCSIGGLFEDCKHFQGAAFHTL